MIHSSIIELNRSALQNNLDYLHNLVGEQCKVSLVVKGNAYGHGIKHYVPLAVELGARHFSTFDANEALKVSQVTGNDVEIMIMGMISNDEISWAIENGIEYYVFDVDRLHHTIKQAKKIGKKARIHIEFETGMNRTGFEENLWKDLAGVLKDNIQHLDIAGFCTHYAGAESIANFIRVNHQYEEFNHAVDFMRNEGVDAKKLHTASSAATIRLPHTRMDMVRVGILQYGFWPNMETFITTVQPNKLLNRADPLRRVISWKSHIMSIKHVNQGEYVGYGTSYLAIHDMKVATVPIGYGYGFSRSLSNTGRALVRGQRVTVVGLVNMNMMMLDITSVEGAEKGDDVILIGEQGELSISVSSFGEYSDQLNYELLTRLPEDIPRVVVK